MNNVRIITTRKETGDRMEERKDEVCDGFEVHEDLLKIVNETLPEETELYDLAELFKVLGASLPESGSSLFYLRQRSAYVILQRYWNVTQSAISHQLRILKPDKLVKSRRREIHFLFPCRRPCPHHYQPGTGSY